eukprot:902518-Prymnesium_polylepis.1
MVMRSYDVTTMRWAKMAGVGEWTKVSLPGAVIATELFLINANSVGGINELDNWLPPPGGCTDVDSCAPPPEDRGNYVFRFKRRREEIPDRDLYARPCALLLKTAHQVFKGRVLSLRQQPPADSCPFDVYVWVPDSLRPTGDVPCNGQVGVDVGSTAMDGVLGIIQLDMACAKEYAAPPPPAPPSPPPSVAVVLRQLRCVHLEALSTAEIRSQLFERGYSGTGARRDSIETLFVELGLHSISAADLRAELLA